MPTEDKRINQCPKPWYSGSEREGSGSLLFSICMFALLVILIISKIAAPSLYGVEFFLFAVILFTLGSFSTLGAHAVRSDNVDSWIVDLPYNALLYELFSEKSLAYLQNNGYDFTQNTRHVYLAYVKTNPETKELQVKSYRIKTGTGRDLDFEMGLIVSGTKYKSYYFRVGIYDIMMDNLEFSKGLQKDTQNILERDQ